MLELTELVSALPERPDLAALVGEFAPPPRFSAKSFADYHPRHPSQSFAAERLQTLAGEMNAAHRGGFLQSLRSRLGRPEPGGGVYLDGGFGVGKTHLLAALWNGAPSPKAYLSFDELVYFIGLAGVNRAREAFSGHRLAAIDEWELDDPGNLKLALAFLRGAVEDGLRVAVTSNTLPLELGAGRFSQKDFHAEIEELAGAFEVVRLEGTDYRHRHFEANPGGEYFLEDEALARAAAHSGAAALLAPFQALLATLARVHPIRYSSLLTRVGGLFVSRMEHIDGLPDALRWVHFVDTLYDSGIRLRASSRVPLGSLFPGEFRDGPYGKKVSRCLSRMEELLAEGTAPEG